MSVQVSGVTKGAILLETEVGGAGRTGHSHPPGIHQVFMWKWVFNTKINIERQLWVWSIQLRTLFGDGPGHPQVNARTAKISMRIINQKVFKKNDGRQGHPNQSVGTGHDSKWKS